VHRDVKPANVLIGKDGVSKLADLGIATAAEYTKITLSGTVLGTAAYMAPEQLEGEDSGPAADVYSLATVAFEALSGRKARLGSTPMEIAHRVATEPPPDLRDAWPTAPPGAAEALKCGMAREPADRPASAGELADSLERGLAEQRTTPTMLAPRTTRERRALPAWLPAAAAVAALAVVGGGAILALGGDDDGSPRSADRPAAAEKPAGKRPERESDAAPKGEQPAAAPAAPAPASSGEQPSGSAASLNARGFALMNQGRYEEAIPPLQRAVDSFDEGSQDLTYAYALFNLGRSLRLAGRPGEAIPILERRLQIPNQQKVVKQELKQAQKAAR
jgi:serine/threonine-protein kinase